MTVSLRSARHLTSVYLVRDSTVLLLYRRGSRAVADSWVGIGGHLEPGELTDPTAAALRELHEHDGTLRFITVDADGHETGPF